jgi:predicted aminopeptidase
MTDTEADSAVYIAFIQELIAELEAVYASGASREEKLQQKAALIRRAQERFAAEYDSRFRSENYRGFSTLNVNNAYLELYRLYYAGGSYLQELYERSGSDLPKFIAAAKTLHREGAQRGSDPKQRLADALSHDITGGGSVR